MRPLVRKEWNKILYRVRSKGYEKATTYICERIAAEDCALFLIIRYLELLLKTGHVKSAGRIFRATRGKLFHPLLDELYSSWLWCCGKKDSAIQFAIRKARYWKKPYLYAQAGALLQLNGDSQMAKRLFLKAGQQ